MYDNDTIHELPKNLKAECAVIGACLIDNSAIDQVLDMLKAEMFYPDAHKETFRAIGILHNEHNPVDLVSVSELLERKNKLELVGGRAYLVTFEQHVLTTQNIGHYCGLVLESWRLREIAIWGMELRADALDYGAESDVILNAIQDKARGLTNNKKQGGLVHISAPALEELDALEARSLGKIDPDPPLKTGILKLDRLIVGVQNEDLVMIVAPTSIGKTAFALCINSNIVNSNKATGYYSMEMAEKLLAQRLWSIRSTTPIVPLRHLREGIRDKDRLMHIVDVNTELIAKPAYISFCPGLTPAALAVSVRSMLNESPELCAIFIDHLHRMSSGGPASESSNTKYERICAALKNLAGETRVPIFCLAQQNRNSERENRDPRLDDIRDSGAIEQEADQVWFIRRDRHSEETQQECKIIVAKNRHGETGYIDALFVKKHARFTDVATEAREDEAYNAQGNLIG